MTLLQLNTSTGLQVLDLGSGRIVAYPKDGDATKTMYIAPFDAFVRAPIELNETLGSFLNRIAASPEATVIQANGTVVVHNASYTEPAV